MNNTHSIIVYSNPLQQTFWESNMLIPLLGGLLVGTLVFLALIGLAERVFKRHNVGSIVFIVAAIAGLVTGTWALHNLMI